MTRLLTLAIVLITQAFLVAQTMPQNQFVPQSQAPHQAELPSAPLFYGAYAFVWAALLVYVFVLWRRIGRVERELKDVHGKLSGKP